MKLLFTCSTWINDNDRKIIHYIEDCDIFPNVNMICQATGIREKSVRHTIRMLRQQEGFCIKRTRLFWIDEDLIEKLHPTPQEILLYRLLLHNNDSIDISGFLEENRYYDEEGNIQYRFTEEEIRNVIIMRTMMNKR